MPTIEIWVAWLKRSLSDEHTAMLLSASVRQVDDLVFTYALIMVEDNEKNQATARLCHVPFSRERIADQDIPDHVICSSCAIEMIHNSADRQAI